MIYKYFRFNENSISCLMHNELWASNPREFNDPFESLVTVDLGNQEVQEPFKNYIAKKAICCFSSKNKNILMWSHYADSHKGFCIGIDEKELHDQNLLAEVIYKEIDIGPSIDEFLNSHKPGFINRNWEKLITHKHEDWKYEQEIRLILENEDPESPGKIYKLPEGVIKNIYFGYKMQEKHKGMINKIMGDRVCYHEMEPSKTSFSLKAHPITPNNTYL